MRSLITLIPFLSVGAVASLGPTSDDWRDYEWSSNAELTADDYKNRGLPLPEVAQSINKVKDGSYVVKLECLGCPFRVRPYGRADEYFETSPQDNSLLFNFTIGADKHSLELNSQKLLPLTPPRHLYGVQTPANLSAETMDKIINMQMMSPSWNVGTKFGAFKLSYDAYSTLAAPGVEVLRFDISNIAINVGRNPGAYALTQQGQKAIQLRLAQSSWEEPLTIESVEFVNREDAIPRGKMACGKDAPIMHVKSSEWDYYGHKGTWFHAFNAWWNNGSGFLVHVPLLLACMALVGGVRFARRRMEVVKARMAYEEDVDIDVEEGLLIVEVEEEIVVREEKMVVDGEEEKDALLGVRADV